MHDYNTILGVIELRLSKVSYDAVQNRATEYLPLDRGRKESHCNRIFRQWKNLSNQCFLCNCNEAV